MRFVDVNRSRKRNPQTNVFDQTAIWDFNQQIPETTHHMLKDFSDIGLPESLRMINGSGVHTFKLVNEHDDQFYCKFHFISHQPFQLMPTRRAVELAGSQPNYFQEDLYNSINSGNFPRWTFAIQVATVTQAENYRWDYLDITKNWRPEDFPIYPVGILELNKMPVDFYAFTEQSAFSPANLVPGIEPSNDRMLHARMFNYADAAKYRLGVNYPTLSVNRPLNTVATYERDGKMCFGDNGGGAPNYFPNSFNGPEIDPAAKQLPFFLSGDVHRADTRDDDNFSQAKLFLEKDISPEEKGRTATRIGIALAMVTSHEIVDRVFQNNLRPLGGNFERLVRDAMENAKRNPVPTIPERT